MKRQFPGVPMLGLTATATTHVLDDVKKILNIQDCQLFRASFNRPNLYYEVNDFINPFPNDKFLLFQIFWSGLHTSILILAKVAGSSPKG